MISGPTRKTTARGFTLVEILIVLTIMAMVLALGLPAITQIVSQKLNSTTRKFVGIVRSVRNDAILLNQIHRIGISFDDRKWWVESQTKPEMLVDLNELTEEELALRQSNFQYVEKYTTEPKELPSGITFGAVVKEREGLVETGVVYLHFFPNGYNEPALVYITREGKTEAGFALDIRATGGSVDIFPESLEGVRESL